MIAAGGAGSGWESLIPAVEREELGQWLDELLSDAAFSAEGAVASQVVASAELSRRVRELLGAQEGMALWIGDSRNSLLLDFWAQQFPEARFVLFYRRLESEVAQALADGAVVNDCVGDWWASNRRLLKFQRRNRGRSVLVDWDAARRFWGDFIAGVRQFGIAIDDLPGSLDTPGELLQLERLVAQSLVSGETDLLKLQAELDAAAVPLGGDVAHPPVTLAGVLEGYSALRARSRSAESEIARRHEADLVPVEASGSPGQELTELRAELDERLTASEAARERADALRRQAEAESELLVLQLGQLHEELEHVQGEVKAGAEALTASEHGKVSLTDDLRRAQAETEVVRLQLQASMEAREEATLRAEGLEAQLREALDAREAGAEALAAAEQRKRSLTDELRRAQAETEVLRLQLQASIVAREEVALRAEGLEAQLKEARDAHQTAEAGRAEITRQNEALRSEAAKLRGEIEGLSARHREALERIERSDREVLGLRQRIADMRQSVAWKAAAPLRVLSGQRRRHVGDAGPASKQAIKLIERSGLFDWDWYLSRYEDVKQSGMHPIKHYLEFGAAEGRDPSPAFETRFYLAAYPDVADSGLNPLLHFIRFGREEGRKTAPDQALS